LNQILAIIPAYNEEERIIPTLGQAMLYLPVLVVDDGSTDATAALAMTAGASVVRQIPNQGKGAALKAGFRYALDNGYEAILMLDADGQHDPAEIPKFIEAFQQRGADLVIGQRDFSRMPFPRGMTNTIGRWMFSWAVGQEDVPDNQSGYRLISRRLLEALVDSEEEDFEFEVEMIAICLKRGMKLEWVPIRTIYAGEGSHIRPLRHVVHYFRIVWKARQIMKS